LLSSWLRKRRLGWSAAKCGKPFSQRVEVSQVERRGSQLPDDLGRLRFLQLRLDSSGPGPVLEILGKEAIDALKHFAVQLVAEGLKVSLGRRAREGVEDDMVFGRDAWQWAN